MTIKFELNISDYIKFHKRHLVKRNFLFQNIVYVVAAVIALSLGLNNWVFNIMTINGYKIPGSIVSNAIWLSIAYDFVVLVGLIFLLRYLYIKGIAKQFKRVPHLIGERELILDDEKLIVKTSNRSSEYNYKIIYNVELVQDYCYVYLNEQDAIIIPKRLQGFDDFVLRLKERLNLH